MAFFRQSRDTIPNCVSVVAEITALFEHLLADLPAGTAAVHVRQHSAGISSETHQSSFRELRSARRRLRAIQLRLWDPLAMGISVGAPLSQRRKGRSQ